MNTRLSSKSRRGFTLVEVMIAVLIISILLAVATPNMVRARETARAKGCVANLKQIEGAKEQWALENRSSATSSPGWAAIDPYMKRRPACPASGTYLIRALATSPTCTRGGGASSENSDDHLLP